MLTRQDLSAIGPILAPIVTPLAAAGLAIMMLLAAVVHARRGERPHVPEPRARRSRRLRRDPLRPERPSDD